MHKIKIIRKGKDLLKIGAKAFKEYINPFVIERAFIILEKPVSLKEEEKWLKKTAQEIDAKKQIKIILFIDEKIAGVCDVHRKELKEKYNVHFGLSIAKEHRKKGYGGMLLKKSIEVAKKYFKPHKLWIEYQEGNKAAKILYEKTGFVEFTELKEYINQFGEWKNKILMEYKGI